MLIRYIALYAIPIIIYPALKFLTSSWPSTATSLGMLGWVADWVGTGAGVAIFGYLGLLYKPNRFRGLLIGMIVTSVLIFVGQNTESR